MRLFVCKHKLQNQCTLVTHVRIDLSCGQFNKETTKYVPYKSDPCFDKCTHIWFNTNLLIYTSSRYKPPAYNGVIQVELHMCILQLYKRTRVVSLSNCPLLERRNMLQWSELVARAALCLPLRKMPSSWINQFHALFHYNFRSLIAH